MVMECGLSSIPVFFLAGVFMIVQRGWYGMVILLLALLAVGCVDYHIPLYWPVSSTFFSAGALLLKGSTLFS